MCKWESYEHILTDKMENGKRKTRKEMEKGMCREDQMQDTCNQKKTVIRFIIKLALVLLSIWAIFTFVFGIRQVSGETMYPRLRDGDLVLYYRLQKDYQIGDVVTFKNGDTTFYGRIVAQGGDVVELDEDGQLLVNGNVQEEEIFYPTEAQDGDVTYPCTVEEGSYFLLCDFRTVGFDSRTYGTVSESKLDGKIITVLRRRGI
jgi:signal peptidase I